MSKLLTIGMSTYDDFDGVYFTIQALRMYHPICMDEKVELLVVDNNPTSSHGKENKNLCRWIKNSRYIELETNLGTASRNKVFENASGKYTICIDCHVLLFPNAIENLLSYYGDNPDCKNIVQGPLYYDNLQSPSTHFKPSWSSCMYGQWDCNKNALDSGKPFEIQMQGLGLFSCETKNWLGFNESFRGFGGEEGYIHEKFRINGGKAICLPGLAWNHRFPRPNGVKYRLVLEDRIWNYFIGWLELTKDPEHEMIKGAYEHFKDKIPKGSIDNILRLAINHTKKET